MTYAEEKALIGRLDSQAPLNSAVKVHAIAGAWAKVSFLDQKAPNSYGYMTAWVPLAHVICDSTFQWHRSNSRIARVIAARTTLYADAGMAKALMVIPFNTELPYSDAYTWTSARVHVAGYGKAYVRRADLSMWPASRGTAAEVIATAKRFIGVPYLWGGTTAFAYDCSGFTYSVLRAHGISVPRDGGPQRNHSGLPTVSRSNLRPGDLVFWSTAPGSTRIRHVGMYLGSDKIIHAPDVGSSVRIDMLSGPGDSTYAGAVRPLYRL